MTEGPFEVPVSKIEPNPDQWADPQVLTWMREVMLDQRGYETTVTMTDVRPNPFTLALNDQVVAGLAEEIRSLKRTPHLFVVRLPDGTYIDVDTPHECEAARRSGIKLVTATVIGTLTESDCVRMGLRIAER